MDLRILIVSQYFWPESFRINDLALALQERGYEVTVLTGLPNYPSGRLFEGYNWWKKRHDNFKGISVCRVPLFLRRKGKGWQLALNYLSFVLFGCLLGPWVLRGQDFDAIFVYEPSPVTVGIPAILLRKLKQAPMLFWVQDLWPDSLFATGAIKSRFILSLIRRMVRWIYRHCDMIPVQSRGFIEPVTRIGGTREKIGYFPNWSEALYQPLQLPPDAPERCEVPSEGFVVMFAGNLGVAQSLETILDAAETLREKSVYWVVLGDGRQRPWMEEQISARGLEKVCLLGRRPLETMPAYFSLADAMLVTLRTDPVMMATIPGKIQSYLACARPILGALDGEGAKVIQESGAGFAVASGDAQGLAAAVLKMSEMGEVERQAMGDAAAAYYQKNFDRERLLGQLEGWLKALVGKRR